MRRILQDQIWQGIGVIIAIVALSITLYLERERLFGVQVAEGLANPTVVVEPTQLAPTVIVPTATVIPLTGDISQNAVATMAPSQGVTEPLFPPAKITPVTGTWIGITEDGCPLALVFNDDEVSATATLAFRDRRTKECFAISQIRLERLNKTNVYFGGGNVQFSNIATPFRFAAGAELSNPYSLSGEISIVEPDASLQRVEWSAQYDH